MSQPMTVREYAAREGITLGTVYRRIWEGQVNATQVYGRWLISPDLTPCESEKTAPSARNTEGSALEVGRA